ncbi:MAG: hypothetical protein HC847_23990 [Hydrococcus sp. RU_2_2]|nr:hypothetical protein [Hydrococcus sp. RU_2_2]NJP18053.1 hypothetical protein [Hydrococcus sp. CRU_1_1]
MLNILELNPQLFREVKSRFGTHNIVIVVVCSLSLQYFLFSTSSGFLVFKSLDYILPLFLFLGGFYLISTDLAREEQRGTLNFIRLSPQSSQSILIGKMLGVPSLIYLGVALGIPLHFISNLHEGVSLGQIVGKYVFWIVGCWLFYSFACLYTLRISSHRRFYSPQAIAGLGLMLAGTFVSPYLSFIYLFTSSEFLIKIDWFFLTLGHDKLFDCFWLLITIVGGTNFLWQAINRRFRNPDITIISKSQSYQLMALLQLWLLGFVLFKGDLDSLFPYYVMGMVWVYYAMPIVFLMSISALSSSRQILLDWSRYKHQSYTRDPRSAPVGNRGLWNDLIWGEKSPAIVAIAINLLITAAIWIPWLLSLSDRVLSNLSLSKSEAILGLLLTIGIVLIYAAIAQQLTIKLKPRSRINPTVAWVMVIVILPLALGGVLALEKIHFPLLWIFSPFPVLYFIQGTIATSILGLGLQFTLLGFLMRQLTKQIQKIGASKTQVLLTAETSQSE